MAIILKHKQKENVTLPESEHTSIFVDAEDGGLKLKKTNGNIFGISIKQRANYHSSASLFGLAALYQLDGNLSESSGNGLDDLVVATGVESYSEIVPGIRGFYFNGSTNINNTTSTALAITGDISMMMFISIFNTAAGEYVAYSTSGETQPTNYLWMVRQVAGGNLQYFAERDAGIDIIYSTNDRIPLYVPVHLAMVRENQTITFYLNGLQIGATSSTLNAPNGGGDAIFNMGLNFSGILSSVAIYSRSLSSDEVKQEYNNTLGSVFGTI